MFDLSWGEIALIGVVAVLVLGPKELPNALRAVGKFTRQVKKLAGDFQGHVNDVIREAELDDLRNSVKRVTNANVTQELDKLLDPSGDFAAELARSEQQIKESLANNPAPPVQAEPEPAMPAVEAAPAPEPAPTPADDTPRREGVP